MLIINVTNKLAMAVCCHHSFTMSQINFDSHANNSQNAEENDHFIRFILN